MLIDYHLLAVLLLSYLGPVYGLGLPAPSASAGMRGAASGRQSAAAKPPLYYIDINMILMHWGGSVQQQQCQYCTRSRHQWCTTPQKGHPAVVGMSASVERMSKVRLALRPRHVSMFLSAPRTTCQHQHNSTPEYNV